MVRQTGNVGHVVSRDNGQLLFLADRTNGRAIGTLLRPSVVVVVCL